MKSRIKHLTQHEVSSDGKTAWVNGADGCCLGRFSWAGIDVHKDAQAQMVGGQCLDCKAGPTTTEDWMRFKEGMRHYYGVSIHDRHMPKFLQHAREMP